MLHVVHGQNTGAYKCILAYQASQVLNTEFLIEVSGIHALKWIGILGKHI